MAEEIIEETTKGRDAPLGNQNARIHGFYSKVLDEESSSGNIRKPLKLKDWTVK